MPDSLSLDKKALALHYKTVENSENYRGPSLKQLGSTINSDLGYFLNRHIYLVLKRN